MSGIERFPVIGLVFLFVAFISSYYYILYQKKQLDELIKTDSSKQDLFNTYKILARWYPAMWVVLLMVVFYMV